MRTLSEGGNAVSGTSRIPQVRVEPTILQVESQILSLLNVTRWTPIGSTGKKESNGDIDLAIESPDSMDAIKKILDDNNIENTANKGLGEISIAFPQYEGETQTEDVVQVDFMLGDYDWLTFMYMGYSESETKYKPLTRTALVYALARIIPEKVNEDGSVEFYSISPARGFFKKTGVRTHPGFKSKRAEPGNNSDPNQLASLIGLSVEELKLPFEKLWAVVDSKFPEDIKIRLAEYVESFLTSQKLEIPSELPKQKLTEATIAHMVHIEDLLYEEGRVGGEKAFVYLEDMFDNLKGHSTGNMKTTVKIDGSPMIAMATSFPGVAGPFVGMKNTFAKVPQVFQTDEAIDEKYGHIPDLANKLKTGLKYASLFNIPEGEIWKGDVLFTNEDIEVKSYEGEALVVFKPNTIVYAIEKDSELGSKVLQSDFGVAFHTIHTGEDIKESESNPSFNVDISRLTIPDTAFVMDVELPSLAGQVFLTEEETKKVEAQLRKAKDLFKRIPDEFLELNSVQRGLVNRFENQAVRTSEADDQFFGDPSIYIEKFVEWFSDKYDKESLTKKTDKGKASTEERKLALIDYFENSEGFYNLISLQQQIVILKKFFIDKLDKLGTLIPYSELPDGSLKLTNNEGFAVSDVDGNIVKFVDRLGFSKANLTGHAPMKETTKADVENYLNNELNLTTRKVTTPNKKAVPDKPNFSADVEPKEDIGRKEKAKAILNDLNPEEVIQADIPTGDSRPLIILNKDEFAVTLNFKDKKGLSKRFSAKDTEEMESWWMYFMKAKLDGQPYPTIEEVREGFGKVDEDWYNSFISGSEAIFEYVDGDSEYYFSRERDQIPESQYPSVHEVINNLFTKKKQALFLNKVGSSKDAWNPSDLYLCHKTYIAEFLSEWKELENNPEVVLEDVNALLSKALSEKDLIGISLKKLTNPNAPHVDQSKEISQEIFNCDMTIFKLSTFTVEDSPAGNKGEAPSFKVVLSGKKNMEVIGTFRFFGKTTVADKYCGKMQLEMSPKGGKAQLGKLPAFSLSSIYFEEEGLPPIPEKAELMRYMATFEDQEETNRLITYASNIEKVFGAQTSVTRADVEIYLNKLREMRLTETRITTDFIKAGFVLRGLYLGNFFATLVSNGRFSEVFSDMLKRTAKMHSVNAPYVKLS